MPAPVLAARPALADWADKDVITGIRPEDFSLAPLQPARMGGEVLLTENIGADAYVFVDLPAPPVGPGRNGGEEDGVAHKGVTRLTVRVEPFHAPARGTRIALNANLERMHFFDPVSGNEIR